MNKAGMKWLAMVAVLLAGPAWAEDALKVAIGQRGNWENAVTELGQDAGFFKKHGLVLDILYTEGGGQTQQAVISGSVDIGIGVGSYGVLGAFSKGAPVRVIGNSMLGARDLYWYVRADSAVKGMKDAGGKSVAFSTTGSSTDLVVRGFQRVFGVTLDRVATGSPPSTFTQVMSGQVDVGWASPPFGVVAAEAGRTRIVARGSDVPGLEHQSVRVMIANARALTAKADAMGRYMAAYREALDWMYSDPAALVAYGTWAGVTPELAGHVRDEFYPKTNMDPARVEGLEQLMADAVTFKFLTAPMGVEQLGKLVAPPPAQ